MQYKMVFLKYFRSEYILPRRISSRPNLRRITHQFNYDFSCWKASKRRYNVFRPTREDARRWWRSVGGWPPRRPASTSVSTWLERLCQSFQINRKICLLKIAYIGGVERIIIDNYGPMLYKLTCILLIFSP